MSRSGAFAEVEELRAAAKRYGAFAVVGPTDVYDGNYGDGAPFGTVLFDGKKHYDGLEPPAADWGSVFVPQCVRDPATVSKDDAEEQGVRAPLDFDALPDREKARFTEVSAMELAAFVIWMDSPKSSSAAQPGHMDGFAQLKSKFDVLAADMKTALVPTDKRVAIEMLNADRRYSSLVQLCVALPQAAQAEPQAAQAEPQAPRPSADATAIAFIRDWGALLSQNRLLSHEATQLGEEQVKEAVDALRLKYSSWAGFAQFEDLLLSAWRQGNARMVLEHVSGNESTSALLHICRQWSREDGGAGEAIDDEVEPSPAKARRTAAQREPAQGSAPHPCESSTDRLLKQVIDQQSALLESFNNLAGTLAHQLRQPQAGPAAAASSGAVAGAIARGAVAAAPQGAVAVDAVAQGADGALAPGALAQAATLKQPLNAYQIWVQGIRADAVAYSELKQHAEDQSAAGIAKVLSTRWAQLGVDEKAAFEQEANRRKQAWKVAKRSAS